MIIKKRIQTMASQKRIQEILDEIKRLVPIAAGMASLVPNVPHFLTDEAWEAHCKIGKLQEELFHL